MTYQRKTKDEYWLMCNYGYGDGWEMVVAEESVREIRLRKYEYETNMPQYPYKIVKKRIPII